MFMKIIARTAELYIQHNVVIKSLLDRVVKVGLEMTGSIEGLERAASISSIIEPLDVLVDGCYDIRWLGKDSE